MRGATQTRKRRVGWSMERTRFTYRYVRGLEIALGGRHQGYYSDGQHAALRMCPFLWLGMLVFFAVMHVHIWVISLVYTQLVFTALFLPALFVWWAVRRAVAWWQFRGQLDAFAQTVGELLGWPEYVKPYLWLHFPIRWPNSKDAPIRIEMKYDAANSEEKKKRILEAVATGLGAKVEDQGVTWDLEVRPSPWPWKIIWPSLTIRPQFPPPDKAMFSDYLDVIGKSTKYNEIVMGIGEHERPYRIDIATEFPHGGIYATSGQGKSFLLAVIGGETAHDGAVPVVLDPKRISLPCFHDLPNVVYAGTGEEIHLTLVELEKEMDRRTALMRVPRGTKRPDPGPPIVILCEEADTMEDYLRRTWEKMTGSRINPPSLAAWRGMRFMGREMKMHQWVVSQTGDAKALGGGGARSVLGNRFVSADESVVGKVAPTYKKDCPISSVPGRWWAFKFGAPVPVQMFGFVDPPDGDEELRMEEARQWAVSGTVAVLPDILQNLKTKLESLPGSAATHSPVPNDSGGQPVVEPSSLNQVEHQVVHASGMHPHLRVVEPVGERLLTLSEGMKAGLLPFTNIETARTAAKKPSFPPEHQPRQADGAKRWPVSVLEQWTRERLNG